MEPKILKDAVLTFLIKEGKVLLAFKPENPNAKVRKIAEGCWNGYGGGQEEGESIEECAIRELREESGGVKAKISDLEKRAIAYFHNFDDEGNEFFVCAVHTYLIRDGKWSGDAKDGDGMINPTWFSINELPYEKMAPGDADWIPHLFGEKKFKAHIYLSKHQREKLKKTDIIFTEEGF